MRRHLLLCFSCLVIIPQLAAQSTRWILSLKQPVNTEQILRKGLIKDGSTEAWTFSQAMSKSEVLRIAGASNVRLIEPDHPVTAMGVPNDPEFGKQWALRNTGQTGGTIGADILAKPAWDIETGEDSIIVGVMDSGIDWQHPDLIHNIWQNLAEDADGDGTVLEWNGQQWVFDPGDVNQIDEDGNGYVDDFIGWDFVNNDNDPSDDHLSGHGTHVSGIIGAESNNGIGVAGIAWNVQLMALKFLDQSGKGYTSDAIAALDYAVQQGAHLSNHSWGGAATSQALQLAVDQAELQGHVMVAAAGNNFGNDNDIAPLYPASYSNDNIIAVGASTDRDSLASFSNIGGQSVDLFAPGKGIYSTLPGNAYGYLSGTSMAAPMVSGAIALLFSRQGILSPISTKTNLFSSTKSIQGLQNKSLSGGRLDLSSLLSVGGSACQVVAYFSIPDKHQCNGAPLPINNQSLSATSYRWLYDQIQFDTTANPVLTVSGSVGQHNISLIAQAGSCADTFEMDVFIDPSPSLSDIDSTHCGPFLAMRSPIQSSIYSYTWTDPQDNVISLEPEVKLTQNGEYELTLTNVCGDEDSADIDVTLTSGCLWPGDADANGIVNMMDFLTMGLTHGSSGATRVEASPVFESQNAPTWSQVFPSQHPIAPSVNYSHSDADGNGTVQIGTDGAIVKANFQGSVDAATSSSSSVNIELQFAQASAQMGDTAFFQIGLTNTGGVAIQDVYGVSMTLSYDLPLSHPIEIVPDLSWLDDSTGIDTLIIHDQAKRQVHVGITRLNQLGTDGYGVLMTGGVTIMIDDIGLSSVPGALSLLTFTISDVAIIRSDGSSIPINPSMSQAGTPLLIYPTPEPSQALAEAWQIGPNPTHGKVWVYPPHQGSQQEIQIELMTTLGQILSTSVVKASADASPIPLQLPPLANGYYLLRIHSDSVLETIPLMYRR